MRPNKRLAARVVKVALHEEIEKVGGVGADGAQLGVAALEDLVAEGGAHVGATLEKGAGELEGRREMEAGRSEAWEQTNAGCWTGK